MPACGLRASPPASLVTLWCVTQTPFAPASVGPQESAPPSPSGPNRSPRRCTDGRGRIAAYVALTKPRIIELLLVTTLPAMVLAAGGLPDWWTVVATMVGGTLAAGSANALNCWVDRDIDAMMRRTTHRPLARHEVSPTGALVFGLVLGVLSVAAIGLATNLLAGGLTLVAIAFYIVVYTMLLKRRTAQNIVWGGAAGCMPVLIGWTAVTGSLALAPFVLFAVVFFWTPPHTWALATRYRDDYARAGVPMLPVVAPPVAGHARDRRLLLADRRRDARAVAVGDRMALRRPRRWSRGRCCSSARTGCTGTPEHGAGASPSR